MVRERLLICVGLIALGGSGFAAGVIYGGVDAVMAGIGAAVAAVGLIGVDVGGEKRRR